MGWKIRGILVATSAIVLLCVGQLSAEEMEDDKGEVKEPIGYQIEYKEADGAHGYYTSPPDIKLTHRDEDWITAYIFERADGTKLQGKIYELEEAYTISKDEFLNGPNTLKVWMEDIEGNMFGEFQKEWTFMVDTASPQVKVNLPEVESQWHNKDVNVHIEAVDGMRESGIQGMKCFVSGELVKETQAENLNITIHQSSVKGAAIPIRVEVCDKAGNITTVKREVFIDKSAPEVSISGVENFSITSEEIRVQYRVKEENILKELVVQTEWENVYGEVTKIPNGKWKYDGAYNVLSQVLNEDGIYRFSILATDEAGHSSEKRLQVVIDKANPVIRYVDELDNQYLKEFRWNHEVEDIVQDFTTYTYEMLFDGQPYQKSEQITKEGNHTLRIHAIDAAGNRSQAEARFVIDHTKPKVIFKDVKDGSRHVQEQVLKIALEDKSDKVTALRINGKGQKIEDKHTIYQYTFQDIGDYRVEVIAKDKAGNEEKAEISFQIAKPENIFQKIIKPVQRALGVEADSSTKRFKIEKKGFSALVWIVGSFGVISLMGGTIYFIRKKRHIAGEN